MDYLNRSTHPLFPFFSKSIGLWTLVFRLCPTLSSTRFCENLSGGPVSTPPVARSEIHRSVICNLIVEPVGGDHCIALSKSSKLPTRNDYVAGFKAKPTARIDLIIAKPSAGPLGRDDLIAEPKSEIIIISNKYIIEPTGAGNIAASSTNAPSEASATSDVVWIETRTSAAEGSHSSANLKER